MTVLKNYNLLIAMGVLLVAMMVWAGPGLVRDAWAVEPICPGGSNPEPNVIFCDDFEDGTLLVRQGRYFEHSNDDEGEFIVINGVGLNGSSGMRALLQAGQIHAGNIKLAFGRNPSPYMDKGIRSSEDFREIYYRMYLRMQNGWVGDPAKLSRATVIADSSWSQAMIAHLWSDSQFHLLIDPVRCVDTSGSVKCIGYNDFANMDWLGNRSGITPIFDSNYNNQWLCIEAHVRLNDPGQSNGIQEFWVDGNLETARNDLDFVKTYDEYGINAVFFENYWHEDTGGSPQQQERYFDNIVVSTQRVGCTVDAININPWESLSSPGWYHSSALVLDTSTDTPDPSGAIRFTYPIGYVGGNGGQGLAEYDFPDQEEFWYGHWFKFPANWQWHPDIQKITYICNGDCLTGNEGNFYVGVTGGWHVERTQKLRLVNQIVWGPGTNGYYSNTGYNPTIQPGQWYWLEVHARMNTPGQEDGLFDLWLDGQLVMQHDNVPYRSSSQQGVGFGLLKHDPIWGGEPSQVKQQEDYFWIDYTVISTGPIGMPGVQVIQINPIADTFINLDSSVNSGSPILNTYTWPDNQLANAVLMKFDLLSIPFGATIQNASLNLYLTEADTTTDNTYTVSVHKIINFDPTINSATGYTYDGVNGWTPNGCCYDNVPLAQADISAAYDKQSIDKTLGNKTWNVKALVQEWVTNPSTNFGLLLNSDPSKLRDRWRYFASVDNSDPALHPYLTITYRP